MVATFLQDDLVEELKLVFKDLRYKTPGGELSEINIFPQALPIPGPAEPPEGESTEYLEEGLGVTDPVKEEDPYPYAIVRIEEKMVIKSQNIMKGHATRMLKSGQMSANA